MSSACASCGLRLPHLRLELLDLRACLVDVLLDQLVDLDLGAVESDGRGRRARICQRHVDGGLGRGARAGAGLSPGLGIGEGLVGERAVELRLCRGEPGGRDHLHHLQVDARILRLCLRHRQRRGRLVARCDEVARIDPDHEIAGLHARIVVDVQLDDVACDLRRDRDGVAVGEGVVRALLVAGGEVVPAAADHEDSHDGGEDDQRPPARSPPLVRTLLAFGVRDVAGAIRRRRFAVHVP